MPKNPPKKDFRKLKKKLHSFRKRARLSLISKHKTAALWLANNQLALTGARNSTKLLASVSLFGTLMLSSGHSGQKSLPAKTIEEQVDQGLAAGKPVNSFLSLKILPLLKDQPIGRLSKELQDNICRLLKETLGVNACAGLEGISLNHVYGFIGYEQHLKRFPGDTLSGHDEEQSAGIAPGLGAWGYFADSKSGMTEEIKLKEKYYVAVQTLYLPGWQKEHEKLAPWFKHRKVLVINPENGLAVAAVVADAGPAQWTGKQFGGSPETMKELGLNLGPRKGKVLLFFITDTDNQVPLGPVDYNLAKGKIEEI